MNATTHPTHTASASALAQRALAASLAAVALCLWLAAVGHAGTYNVYACDAAGGANNSWGAYNSYPNNLILEETCPTGGNYTVGLVARTMVKPNAVVPNGTHAKWLLGAPGGATITNVTINGWSTINAGGWRRGVDSNAGNWWGWGGGDGGSIASPPNNPPFSPVSIPISHATAVGIGIQCEWSSCNTYNGNSAIAAKMSFQSAVVTIEDFSAPALRANSGALWNDGWHRGFEEAWFATWDNVGIRLAFGQIDGSNFNYQDFNDGGWPSYVRCDYTFTKPCKDVPNVGAGLHTAGLSDGSHALRLALMDAAGNFGWVDRTIRVDNHAPTRPQGLAVTGGEGWRQTNNFNVTWTNPSGQTAPITAARWRMCKDGQPSQCSGGTQSANGIAQLTGLQAPNNAPGDYWLQVRLIDEAANETGSWDDASFVAGPLHLRFDNTPPGRAAPDVRDGWISAPEASAHPERIGLGAGETMPPSGIAGYAVTLDGTAPGNNVTHPGAQATVYLNDVPDGTHTLSARAISGSGVPSGKVGQSTLRLDRQAPSVTALDAPDPQHWNRERVTFSLAAADQPGLSGMAASADEDPTHGAYVAYQLDGGPVERVAGAKAPVSLADDGRHTLTYHAVDVAGNHSDERTISFKIDATPPQLAFRAQDPLDPRRLRVSVADATSGVVGGEIEMRRQGARIWDSLPTTLEDTGLVSLLDDHVPDGVYEFRALARDGAGNDAVSDRLADGAPKRLTFPLRLASKLTLSSRRPTRRVCPRRRASAPTRRCRSAAARLRTLRLAFGATRRVYGRVATGEGRAIPNTTVEVYSVLAGRRDETREAVVRADSAGRFVYRVPAGPARTLRFHYDGTNILRYADTKLAVKVPARSTLKASRRYMHVGQRVVFHGRVLGGHIPEPGKVIAMQAFDRGRWRTFATPRTDRDGRWRLGYRFEVSRGRYTYRFRVLVTREEAFPYETGYSPVVAVTVQGT